MLDARKDLAFGSVIGSEFISHDHSGHVAQTLQQLAKEALGRLRVAAALNQDVEHVAVLINGSPLSVRELGTAMDAVLEIHGQNESHQRVAGQSYRELVDEYGTSADGTSPETRSAAA